MRLRHLPRLALLTVFLFIMVLLLEFKTFKSMLIVLSVIPLGIIGGLLALWTLACLAWGPKAEGRR